MRRWIARMTALPPGGANVVEKTTHILCFIEIRLQLLIIKADIVQFKYQNIREPSLHQVYHRSVLLRNGVKLTCYTFI